MGLPLIYGFPPRRGESEPYPGGREGASPDSASRASCGQKHSFHYHQEVHIICPHTDSQKMLDSWVSFLRHSLRRFPEGNLVARMYPMRHTPAQPSQRRAVFFFVSREARKSQVLH